MKRKLINIFLLSVAACCFTACLNDSDDIGLVYYDDTAITSFSLGTLNRTMVTKDKNGNDSLYTTTVNGSVYAFRINEQTREIYNPDSLPYGTDITKCPCTVTTKNSGTAVLKITPETVGGDSLYLISSIDSLDLSQPTELRVYNGRATAYRSYTLKVNVHKQKIDYFGWQQQTLISDFALLADKKIVSLNGRLLVLGNDGTSGIIYKSDDGITWTPALSNINTPWQNDISHQVAVKDGKIYLLNGNSIFVSEDGEIWSQLGYDATLTRLIGVGQNGLYALTATGISSSANGTTWTPETLGDPATLLPTENIHLLTLPQKNVTGFNRLLLLGNRSIIDFPTDQQAMVWSKMETTGTYAVNEAWIYYDLDKEIATPLPRLTDLQGLVYNQAVYVFGFDAEGNTVCYYTIDNGINWSSTTNYQLPDELSAAKESFTMTTDSDNFMWLVSNSGKVWKGRLSQLGW